MAPASALSAAVQWWCIIKPQISVDCEILMRLGRKESALSSLSYNHSYNRLSSQETVVVNHLITDNVAFRGWGWFRQGHSREKGDQMYTVSGYIIDVHTLSLFLFEEYTIIQSEDTNLREILARMVYCCDSWWRVFSCIFIFRPLRSYLWRSWQSSGTFSHSLTATAAAPSEPRSSLRWWGPSAGTPRRRSSRSISRWIDK